LKAPIPSLHVFYHRPKKFRGGAKKRERQKNYSTKKLRIMKKNEKTPAQIQDNEAAVLKVVTDHETVTGQDAPGSEQTQGTTTADNAEPTGNQPFAKAALRKKASEVMTVENIVKWVADMNYLNNALARLKDNADRLRAFEIAQKAEPDDTESSYWSGCVLTIKDDNRKEYTLKNPALIAMTVEFLFGTYDNKAAEIESTIMENAQKYPY
jgi:hypothetical protein